MTEPLDISAPLARKWAAQHCGKGAGQECSWSHGLWQYLRLMGLVTSPDYHAAFYRHALAGVDAAAGAPRILVSGAADYGMLAQVIAAFRDRGVEPDVTVVDICETPLALSRWYAERVSCAIRTQRADMLAFTADAPFDAVCSDSFFGRFSPQELPRLLTRWRDALRPGGKAITVNRVRASSADEPVVSTPLQARQFRDAVVQAAQAIGSQAELAPGELAEMAERYALSQRTYPVGPLAQFRVLFEASGFAVDALSAGRVDAGNLQGSSGPSVRGNQPYARIIASRN